METSTATAAVARGGSLAVEASAAPGAGAPGPDPAGGRAGRDDGRAGRHDRRGGQPGHPGAPERLAGRHPVGHQRLPARPGGQPDHHRQAGRPVRAQEGVPDRRDRFRAHARRPSACPGHRESIGLVIAFRALQGVFGAMLQPTALALLRNTFPAGEAEQGHRHLGRGHRRVHRGRARSSAGCWSQHVGWEACFYVNVPVGIVALVIEPARAARDPAPRRPPARSTSPASPLLSGALFLLVWGLIKGPDYGWGSARTLAFLGGAVVALAAFVAPRARARQPLLPLRLFRSVSAVGRRGAGRRC